MKIHKRFNYRVYPNKSTIARLDQWNSTLKWLWNLANEQRRNGYGRSNGDKIYPSFFSQTSELTELRQLATWVRDVPRHACGQILANLDTAWKRCFSKVSNSPKWKKKLDRVGITESDARGWQIKSHHLRFPRLAPMKIVLSRPLEGKAKSCTLFRDGDQWFASIVCEIDIPDPSPRTEPKVGIDRGITNIIADSDRRLLKNPKFFDKSMNKLARAQRTVSRRVKGSRNREKAKNVVSRIYRKVRRQSDHFCHIESIRYAKSHGTVVLEKLNILGLVKGRLSRQIYGAGWGKFAAYLKYKLEWSGGVFVEVDPCYTSQTCAVCNHVDRASRSGEKFRCTKCGHENHADLNASVNILKRASRTLQPVEGSSKRAPRRSRKYKSVKVDSL